MKIEVLCHSSIKIQSEENIIYIDPFRIKEEKHDADIVAITHSHYDHFSEEDINKIKKEETKILITTDLLEKIIKLGFKKENIIEVMPDNSYKILDLQINTIPAYNVNKEYHPKKNNWVGYILILENKRVYIAGDTDVTNENKNVECDIALVPVGGTYTMSAIEAAQLINTIKPEIAIPTHYGEIVGDKKDGINFSKFVKDDIKIEIQIQ